MKGGTTHRFYSEEAFVGKKWSDQIKIAQALESRASISNLVATVMNEPLLPDLAESGSGRGDAEHIGGDGLLQSHRHESSAGDEECRGGGSHGLHLRQPRQMGSRRSFSRHLFFRNGFCRGSHRHAIFIGVSTVFEPL